MNNVTTLPSSFRHVRLLLAREKDHPEGARDEGYDLVIPLDHDGRLAPHEWKSHQALCRISQFHEHGDERIGRLRRKPGGQWYFDYQDGDTDDEIGFRLGEERFVVGEYVSVGTPKVMHTYRVVLVETP